MVMSLFFSVFAVEEKQAKITLHWDRVSDSPDRVRVYFSINEKTDMGHLSVELNYDNSHLQWVPMKDVRGNETYVLAGNASKGAGALIENSGGTDSAPGIVWISMAGAWDGGVLYYCEFLVLSYPENGPIPMNCTVTAIGHYVDYDIPYAVTVVPTQIEPPKADSQPETNTNLPIPTPTPTDTTPTDIPEIVYGELNQDEVINAKDALCVLRYSVGKQEFTPLQKIAAELDGKERINAKDALLILKFSVLKIQKFPIEMG